MFNASIRLTTASLIAMACCASALACDPEDLKTEYRALCATPTDAIAELVKASAGKLNPKDRALLISKAKQAQQLCLEDKYDEAMKLSVRVARALGSAEREAGLPKDLLAEVPKANQVASR